MNERNNKLELLGSAPIPKALMALGITDYDWDVDQCTL